MQKKNSKEQRGILSGKTEDGKMGGSSHTHN